MGIVTALMIRWHSYGYSHGTLARSFAHGFARAIGWRLAYSLGAGVFGIAVAVMVTAYVYGWLRRRHA